MRKQDYRHFDSLKVCLAIVCIGLISGCSSFDVLNTFTRSSHYTAHTGLRYAPHERGLLDVYVPVDVQGDAPIIVFFYGGGWREGSREDYAFVASELTREGFVVVIPDYRLHPNVQFPEFVVDAADAYQFAYSRIGDFGLAENHWFVAGHSAGGHIAALLAMDRQFLGVKQATIDGWVGLSGPYDFLPLEGGYLKTLFPEQVRQASQPIGFVGPHVPPTLLIHGDDDKTVGIGNSERLAAALESQGVDVTLHRYAGVAHARVVAAMASPLSRLAPTTSDIVAFVRDVSGRKGSGAP